VVFRPAGRSARVPAGTLVTDAAAQVGVAVEQVCGGKGTCGKCKVKALADGLSPMSETERRHLTEQEVADGLRLACQATVLEDTTVEVGWASSSAGISILVEGLLEPVPSILWCRRQWRPCRRPPSRIRWPITRPAAGPPRRGGRGASPTLYALRVLPGALRAEAGLVTAVRSGNLLLSVEPGDTRQALHGFAVDIGTTTVVGYLLDLNTGQRVAVASTLNPQTRFGDDVVSRIDVAQRDAQGSRRCAPPSSRPSTTCSADNREAGLKREQVYALSIVGQYDDASPLLGLNPAALGQRPMCR